MRRVVYGLAAFISSATFGQAPSHPAFEVAVVRRALPGGVARRVTGGPGTPDPTRFDCLGSMWAILQVAFGVKGSPIEQLPDWARERRLEIEAKVPPGATKSDLQEMLQAVLKDSFGLAFHMRKKEITAYDLVVAKGGPKLQPAAAASGPPPERLGLQQSFQAEDRGFPVLPPGYSISARTGASTTTGAIRMTFRNAAPAALLAAIGRGSLEFSDKTGFSGPYDFTLEYDPESVVRLIEEEAAIQVPEIPGYQPNAPDIFTALEKQLGLKLEKGRHWSTWSSSITSTVIPKKTEGRRWASLSSQKVSLLDRSRGIPPVLG